MSELFDDPDPGQNAPEFTVTELSGAVKRAVEGGFPHVRVRGEVGRVSRPRSGHLYLDLKDDRAVLAAVVWKGVAAGLRTQPEEGMEVVATGRLTTFPGQSRYQLVIEHIAPAGVGALMAMLEKRKAQLTAEGLFDAERKRPLPFLPEVIGVVTSPSGAVIRDILHRLRDRFPRKVLVWPVAVQGEKCAPEVSRAIAGFNALTPGGALPRPDLIIVARGGGSLEDLWGFNEEVVVRAAAESRIPLISAVGHETDTTLIDFAADRRAPTPTAAAEMAVPVRAELLATVAGLEERRRRGVARMLERRRERLTDLARALPRPEALVAERSQRLDYASTRLPQALLSFARAKRLELARGDAGRFGPQLLTQGMARKSDRLWAMALRLAPALSRSVDRARERVQSTAARLRPTALARPVADGRRELERLGTRLDGTRSALVEERADRLSALSRVLETLSYRATLARGYAVVRDGAGAVISDGKEAEAQSALEIEFRDGARVAVTPSAAPPPKRAKAAKKPPPDQGSLF
ncbi:MAG: exodeoxyribonuclease VII large subunit [Pseudomonadota bacterium]